MKIKIAKLGMIVGLLVTIIVFPPTVYSEQKGGMSPSTETTTGKTVRVGLSKWCEDGSFKYEVVELPENEYRNLLEKIETCKSPEKAFSIFQEYGLVPKNKTLEDLIEVMKIKSMIVSSPSCSGDGAILSLHIYGPVWNLYFPFLFFAWISNGGDFWMAYPRFEPGGPHPIYAGMEYCEGQGSTLSTGFILVGVGIMWPPLPPQPYHLGDIIFFGFALMASVIVT